MLSFITPHGKIEVSNTSSKYPLLCYYLELITMKPEKVNDFEFTVNNCVSKLAK